MGIVDLRRLEGDQIVIHFGGSLTSVDVYTFGNSLVAFADTVRSVNGIVNPGQNIEIRLEAIGPGSFRAVVKRLTRGLGGFLSRGTEAIFWGLIATLIYEKIIRDDPGVRIIVNNNNVTINTHGDTIIIPRNIYDQMPNIRSSQEVQKNLSRTLEVIERDDAIENFGLSHTIADPEPLVQIPREEFSRLASAPVISEGDIGCRERIERARLVILKVWFRPGPQMVV